MPQMLLPKGIVLNTDRIYKEVASYSVVPPEKIWEYWHVYTTTQRTLVDPTAKRLENFWWQVMGSDCRHLSGHTLAKLFEHISTGPTVVKLKGPANRYEPPPLCLPSLVVTSSRQPQQGDNASKGQKPAKTAGYSSSRPPPPHPILKKPSHPSAAGPRPTARFVSPPGSDAGNDDRDSELVSSGSTVVNSGQETRPPTAPPMKEDRKKSAPSIPKKKDKKATFVASATSKRRPSMPRRQSSQSSSGNAGPELVSKKNNLPGASQKPVSPVDAVSGHDGSSEVADADGWVSAKAAGKRPAVRSSSSASKVAQRTASQSRPTVAQKSSADAIQTKSADKKGKGKANGKEPAHEDEKPPTDTRDTNRQEASNVQDKAQPPVLPPPVVRARSDMGARPRSQDFQSRGPSSLISTSTVTMSNVAAQGTIIEFDENAPAQAVMRARAESGETRPPSSSILSRPFTPTAPSETPNVPLGRSKSQLTLLLERDNGKKTRR